MSIQTVYLRDDTDFPMLRFGSRNHGTWHVMVTRATARCGRIIDAKGATVLRSMRRDAVCAQCVTAGLANRTIRVA